VPALHQSQTFDDAALRPAGPFDVGLSSGTTAARRGEDGRVRRLASLAYLVLGVMIASQHGYYADLATVSRAVSAVVATALWPLNLFGASLHLSLALS
jgi:hypothetical protein